MPKSLHALQGVVPPVVTPLNANFTVDYKSFTAVIESNDGLHEMVTGPCV